MRTYGVRVLPATLLIALGCIFISGSLYAKKLPKRPPQLQPRAHHIKCADVLMGRRVGPIRVCCGWIYPRVNPPDISIGRLRFISCNSI
jgi:hypothetical protein